MHKGLPLCIYFFMEYEAFIFNRAENDPCKRGKRYYLCAPLQDYAHVAELVDAPG